MCARTSVFHRVSTVRSQLLKRSRSTFVYWGPTSTGHPIRPFRELSNSISHPVQDSVKARVPGLTSFKTSILRIRINIISCACVRAVTTSLFQRQESRTYLRDRHLSPLFWVWVCPSWCWPTRPLRGCFGRSVIFERAPNT